ncbi:AAA family ATPase [Paraliobacillus sediminis]|uniref:AAA family ATPase n=1 Tax=Paraliobacillus sediminis TaxID=1885916 RepID=UPI000E3DB407|nr:SMC family ATPase [Paraliobacillus sediminis]
MRAVSIMLSAFGPYKAEQEIDFRELGNESIFLITGPTGAGKTTIFDAICFALYGKASGSERDHDTFRSHFATPDDKTAVSFTFQLKERTYFVYRQPKQQKPKERGEGFREEPALAELYQIEDGEKQLLHSKIKDVNETIEEMLGLDYDQFRKMIMIPQGEFRKLIAENSNEREEILQKIFRTYFYQDVTEALKAQAKDVKEKLEQTEWKVTQEMNKIEWDDPALVDLSTINNAIEALHGKIKVDKEKSIELKKMITEEKKERERSQEAFFNGKQIADKFLEKAQLSEEKKNVVQQKPDIEEKKQALSLGERANTVLPYEKQAADRRQEWKEQQDKVVTQNKQLVNLEKAFEEMTEKYNVQKQQEKEKQEEFVQLGEKKKQVEKLRQYTQRKIALEAAHKKYTQINDKVQSTTKVIEDKQKALLQLEEFLRTQSQQTKVYYQVEKELAQAQESDKKSQTLLESFLALEELRMDYKQVKNSYMTINQQIKDQRKRLQEMEVKQQTNHAYVLASHLHDGEACQVCGSTDHPAKANIEAAVISEEAFKKEQNVLIQLEEELPKWQDAYVHAKSKGETKRDMVENLASEFNLVLDKLNKETLKELTEQTIDKVEKKKQALKEEEIKVTRLEKAELEKQDITKEIEKLNNALDTEKKQLEEAKNEQVIIETQVTQLKADIPDQSMTIDEWQEHIQKTEQALDRWFKQWEQQQKAWEDSKQQREEARLNLISIEKFTAELAQRKDAQQAIFTQKVEEAGFTSTLRYQEAKKSTEQLNKLKDEIEHYTQLKQKITERLDVLTEQLNNQTEPDLEKLKETVDQHTKKLEETNQSFHAIELKIQQHEKLHTTVQKLVKEQQIYEKKYFDIAELADLARGTNHLKLSFERYVLSSFLDEILLQANIRMDQLTENRYQLIRSNEVAKRGAKSGLDLEVMDQHTGQQRSVKTLSGGEGFKAALSLALGMADVVQAHSGGVQLETLFIDEGFGTLDELSLEQAIECLKGLQQSNRVLGIISHVPQLKEEIYAKLQITPSAQGSHAVFTF